MAVIRNDSVFRGSGNPNLDPVIKDGGGNMSISYIDIISGAFYTFKSDNVSGSKWITANVFSGDYNDLINKPTNVSFFSNDAGYITQNFYTHNGDVTSPRTVNMQNHDLFFTNGDIFTYNITRLDLKTTSDIGLELDIQSPTSSSNFRFNREGAVIAAMGIAADNRFLISTNVATGIEFFTDGNQRLVIGQDELWNAPFLKLDGREIKKGSWGDVNISVFNNNANYATTGQLFSGDYLDLINRPITISTAQANAIIANTAKISNATHTGDVTGSTVLTIGAAKVLGSMLNDNVISSRTALTSGLVGTDEMFISDAGVLKRMDVSVLRDYMQSALTFTSDTDTNNYLTGVDFNTGNGNLTFSFNGSV